MHVGQGAGPRVNSRSMQDSHLTQHKGGSREECETKQGSAKDEWKDGEEEEAGREETFELTSCDSRLRRREVGVWG